MNQLLFSDGKLVKFINLEKKLNQLPGFPEWISGNEVRRSMILNNFLSGSWVLTRAPFSLSCLRIVNVAL